MIFVNNDIIKISADCIIIPNNGRGIIKKGVSKSVIQAAGKNINKETIESCFKQGFYKAGDAFETHSGNLSYNVHAIIHAIVKNNPQDKCKIDFCRKAIISSIILMKERGFKSLVIPSIGIEPRNIDAKESAQMMIETLKPFDNDIQITVADINRNFINICSNLI